MQRPSLISFSLLTDRLLLADCNKRSVRGNDSQWHSCLLPQMAPCQALWKRQSNAMRWPWVSCLSASRCRWPSWSLFAEVVLLFHGGLCPDTVWCEPQTLIAESPPSEPKLLMMAVIWIFVSGMREPCSALGLHTLEAHFLPLHRIRVLMFKRWGGGILPRLWAMGNPSDSLVPWNKDSCWSLQGRTSVTSCLWLMRASSSSFGGCLYMDTLEDSRSPPRALTLELDLLHGNYRKTRTWGLWGTVIKV